MGNSKYMDMTEGNLFKKILLFSIPLMFSSIFQLLFNAVDIVVVGKFAGDQSLAAVSSTSSLINLITQLFIGLSIGTNVIVAKHIGEHDSDKIYKSISTSVILSVIGGLLIGVFGYFIAKPSLALMATPDDVIDLSTIYLKIYFVGMPAIMFYNFGAAILRAQGDTKRPLYFLTIAGVINALLNLLFVIVLKLDVAGVALATTISQYISSILLFECIRREEYPFCFDLHELQFDATEFKEIFIIGLPAGIQSTVFSISNVLIQASVNSFGSIVMAGNGAASNIEGFAYAAMNSFYQSSISFTSQNLGAKKFERINPILFISLFYVVVTGIITGTGAYLIGRPLLSIYTNDPEVIDAGMIRMNYICKIYFICGMMDVLCGSIRGLGDSITPMVNSLLWACVFRIVWIMTIFKAQHTLQILYVSYPITWILTMFFHVLVYIVIKRRVTKKLLAN